MTLRSRTTVDVGTAVSGALAADGELLTVPGDGDGDGLVLERFRPGRPG